MQLQNPHLWGVKFDQKTHKSPPLPGRGRVGLDIDRCITWERHVFNTRNQRDDETIDQYATDLKKKAKTWEFQDLKDGLIRDRIVCGIRCDKTRSRLLKEPDLNLQKAIDICRANEATITQMESFVSTTTDEMTDIHRIRSDRQVCERCGTGHNKQQLCPAMGAQCRKCGRKNHFAKMCRTKTRPLYGIQTDEDYVSTDMFIGTIQRNQKPREWQITLPLNNQRLKFKIDTGAQCNVIPKQRYLQVSKAPLQKSTANLMAFGGSKLTTCGKAILPCQPAQ